MEIFNYTQIDLFPAIPVQRNNWLISLKPRKVKLEIDWTEQSDY